MPRVFCVGGPRDGEVLNVTPDDLARGSVVVPVFHGRFDPRDPAASSISQYRYVIHRLTDPSESQIRVGLPDGARLDNTPVLPALLDALEGAAPRPPAGSRP